MSDGLMHVLTLTPFYPVVADDAQGCFVEEPLHRMEQLGVRHTVFAVQPFYRGVVRPHPSAATAHGLRYFALPGGVGLPTSGLSLFARIIREVRHMHASDPIDVVHAHSALPCGHAAALLSRELHIPFVVTVHGLDAYATQQVHGLSGRWCERVSRLVYRSACRSICVSQKVAQQVAQGATTPVRTTVVYNGVDPDSFSPAQPDTESKRILSVGGLIAIKGHELLIRAFATIHLEFPDCTCELIGNGPERDRLERLVQELGIATKVQFRGRRSRAEVAAAMQQCTLFVLPSRYEALGCVYLEAMSSGKAVVACRGQGIEEVIHSGKNGWLVDPNDVSQLSAALSALLEDGALRHRIGTAARQTILSGFTLTQQAQALRQVYEECAL